MQGLDNLRHFVAEGGTLVALGEATNLLVDKLPLGIKDVKKTATRDVHFAPGTVVNLQVDTAHPIGRGVRARDVGLLHQLAVLPADRGLLLPESDRRRPLSQYRGQRLRLAPRRRPHVRPRRRRHRRDESRPLVLFGIRPQHRAQTHATLPLLFNALYWPVQGDVTAAN